jgi:hypothetical protein
LAAAKKIQKSQRSLRSTDRLQQLHSQNFRPVWVFEDQAKSFKGSCCPFTTFTINAASLMMLPSSRATFGIHILVRFATVDF